MTNRQVNLATSVSRFTESSLHTLANGKEFYGQVILFYLSRMLEKTKPMVNYLMNNLAFGFSVFTVVENQSKSLILQPYELKQNILARMGQFWSFSNHCVSVYEMN